MQSNGKQNDDARTDWWSPVRGIAQPQPNPTLSFEFNRRGRPGQSDSAFPFAPALFQLFAASSVNVPIFSTRYSFCLPAANATGCRPQPLAEADHTGSRSRSNTYSPGPCHQPPPRSTHLNAPPPSMTTTSTLRLDETWRTSCGAWQ
ncbi:hypothetical protein LZ32DRAFT_29515 [Colletotrichum eremochloae]|nr:hypothetical protein LZ32DRAFT_29515 [Colletotrichum eremochloae]